MECTPVVVCARTSIMFGYKKHLLNAFSGHFRPGAERAHYLRIKTQDYVGLELEFIPPVHNQQGTLLY